MSRLKKLSLGFLVLSVIFGTNVFSVSAQEKFVVTLGQDKIFTRFNYHNSGFANDPNNPEPWPDKREALATGNIAHVSLLATPGHAGQAMAFTGIQFQWNLGQYTWEEVKNWPVRITLNFSYQIEAYWTDPNGSANAGVVLPYNLVGEEHIGRSGPMRYFDWIGFEVGSSGMISGTANETYTTRWDGRPLTVEELDGWGRIIDIQAYCQAHSIYIKDENGNPIGTTHYSHAEIQLQSIKIEFLEVIINGPNTTWIYNPDSDPNLFKIRTNPTIRLEALENQKGGTYHWEIIEGDDKIEFVNVKGSKVDLRGKKPSNVIGDVKVKVTYLVDSQEVSEDTHLITVQRATYLCQIGGPRPVKDSKFSNETEYKYEILDQFGYRIVPSLSSPSKQPFVERIFFYSSNHLPACPFPLLPWVERDYDDEGIIYDDLSFQCTGTPHNPGDLIVRADQDIWVSGWIVAGRRLTFYSNYAVSEPRYNHCIRD